MEAKADAHFGRWLKKIRSRLGLSQGQFAILLGLKTHAAIYQAEQKPERRLRSDTLESLLDLLGLIREEDLDEMWEGWTPP